jgi:NCS1 family nucleobase:cation symporter-1
MTTAAETKSTTSAIEFHHIDYIPKAERHGKVRDQFTLWFLANAELATLAVGFIGISLGLSLGWTLVAIILGEVFGTFFMAFHAVQGPRLGIPQMLQSRPQFGFLGALIPQFIAVFLFVGFNVFNTIIGGAALAALTGLDLPIAVGIMAVVAFGLTMAGYDWIHFVQKWGTYIFLIVFGIFTVAVLFLGDLPAEHAQMGEFQLTPFLVVLGAVAAYQVSQAPYVSDYSRYLEPSSTSRATFLWTYWGSMLGSFWMIALGALLLAMFPEAQTVDSIISGGDLLFSGFGTIALASALIGMVTVIALNMYSGSLSGLSAADVVVRAKPGRGVRFVAVLIIAVLGTAGSLLLPEDFLGSYGAFLALILYALTPWTAVNLVDFYLVRKGNYAILEIFKPKGIYGSWNGRGLAAYFIGLVAMVPFMSIAAIFVGPVANSLDGADIAVFVGLPVSAIAYWILTRNLDMTEEQRLAAAEASELEAAGEATMHEAEAS